MRGSFVRPLLGTSALWLACGSSLWAQSVPTPPVAPKPVSKTEPGLEQAVKWKWRVTPAAKEEWGIPLPEPKSEPGSPGAPGGDTAFAGGRPDTYEVVKGDALVKIAKKFQMTVVQLKQFNQLPDDRIFIGQILRIPTPGEILEMAPPPPPPPPPEPKTKSKADAKKGAGKDKKDTGKIDDLLMLEPLSVEQLELEIVQVQVFLDREMFSSGGIDGKDGPTFQKICQIYQQTHPDAPDKGLLQAKARAEVKEPYTSYLLREEDFKFIKLRNVMPVTEPSGKAAPAGKKGKKGAKSAKPATLQMPPVSYEELVAADFLSYTSAWEFVAERFHCDEEFLRRINSRVQGVPAAGTIFQVPNVIPFEIEKALDKPLQPAADPQKPVTVAVVDLSLLEISREGKLIAVMPVASARPGLRGRGEWTVLDVIPQPRLVTRQEPRETPKAPSATASAPTTTPVPSPAPGTPPAAAPAQPAPAVATIPPPLEADQFLASGPNNPLGILWINLAKSNSTEALPYGLHGTSIPAKMKLEGIGGFRLTNWDIARAVRLIPANTPLHWKAQ